jgi:hypothetical protein
MCQNGSGELSRTIQRLNIQPPVNSMKPGKKMSCCRNWAGRAGNWRLAMMGLLAGFSTSNVRFVRRYGNYCQIVPQIQPIGVGFFAGKIDYSRLKLLPRLFVRFIIRAKEGDYRNWPAIRAWTENIRQDLVGVA